MRRFDRTYMPLLLMKLELKICSLCGLNKPKCIECGNVAPASRHTMQETYGYRSKARGQLLSLFFEKTQLLVFSVKYVLHDFVYSFYEENARRDAEQQASQTRIANLERLVMYWKESDPAFAAFVASQPQPTAPANTQAANATATANAPATAPT
ncbi:unnamed protein product [Arabidopsis lyrata]|nr:unnamed protein product [Arabidopsis lyrata]